MPKASKSGKMINFNFSKVSKLTKIICPELSAVSSNFVDAQGLWKDEREEES